MLEVPAGVLPVQDLTTRQILYGARTTRHRYELLSHDAATGLDSLVGFLDGVQPGGKFTGSAAKPTKWGGGLTVNDLPVAREGMIRIGDVDLMTTRIRPVLEVEGLPEMPRGVYVVTSAPEAWSDTGRTFELELLDKTTVLAQDRFDETFTAVTGLPILEIVRQVIVSAGEQITIDGSDTSMLKSARSWGTDSTKLQIVNELLRDSLNYNSLSVDSLGEFRATPSDRPASRSIRYSVLNEPDGERMIRELKDGQESIYSSDWSRDRDGFEVPNKVIARQTSSGDEEPLSGFWVNEDPDSPFSYQRRGNRWVVAEPLEVETPDFSAEPDPVAATILFLEDAARRSLIARSSVSDTVSVKCLPIPLELLDALMFASTPAGLEARHTVQRIELDFSFDGMMKLDLLRVVDL